MSNRSAESAAAVAVPSCHLIVGLLGQSPGSDGPDMAEYRILGRCSRRTVR